MEKIPINDGEILQILKLDKDVQTEKIIIKTDNDVVRLYS